jgi:type IV pilus assembly protein PilK
MAAPIVPVAIPPRRDTVQTVPAATGLSAGAVFPQLAMAEDQFGRWVTLLEKRTGIVLPANRRDFLASNLRSRMREVGASNFDDYYAAVQTGPKASVEWAILVDRLTVHQTHFFRHLPSFTCVGDWLDTRFAEDGTLSAWSVGCSTGEEAYSLAMQIEASVQKSSKRIQYGVSGTDVSQLSLMTAKRGVYGNLKQKEIPLAFFPRFTRAVGADSFEIIEGLRRRVAFSPFNLLDIARADLKPFDLIYCQNVMIYFSRERRVELLDAFSRLLNPGGLLIIGSGEVTSYANPAIQRIENKNVLGYKKLDTAINS